MTHTYLLDLYQALNERRRECASPSSAESGEEEAIRRGRGAATAEVLAFLQENYHSRLPRRLQSEALRLLAQETIKPSSGEDQ